MLRITLALAALTMFSACAQAATPEEQVRKTLAEPDSAEFQETKQGARKGTYCGKVNVKNRSGTYIGYTPFMIEEATNTVAVVAPPDRDAFHNLWRARESDLFSTQFNDIARRCTATARWKDVCGEDYPGSRHQLCETMIKDRTAVLNKMKAEFGR